jgi:hypothetical protein
VARGPVKDWYRDHVDVLDRLGVGVWKVGPLHELGHHHDRMTTRSERYAARGEVFAEQFAIELADEIWDDFLRVFPV